MCDYKFINGNFCSRVQSSSGLLALEEEFEDTSEYCGSRNKTVSNKNELLQRFRRKMLVGNSDEVKHK